MKYSGLVIFSMMLLISVIVLAAPASMLIVCKLWGGLVGYVAIVMIAVGLVVFAWAKL